MGSLRGLEEEQGRGEGLQWVCRVQSAFSARDNPPPVSTLNQCFLGVPVPTPGPGWALRSGGSRVIGLGSPQAGGGWTCQQ